MKAHLTLDEVYAVLKNRQGDGTQKDLADSLRVSPQYLHDVLQGRRLPGKKILGPMGLEAVTYYRIVTGAPK